MTSPTRRGSSFTLGDDQQVEFRADFGRYALEKIGSSEVLWYFGTYGQYDANLEKKAPILIDLVNNSDFLEVLLRWMPNGICRDSYMTTAIQGTAGKIKNVNNTTLPMQLFVLWLVRIIHCSISHLRNIRLYKPRFQYRINKMKPDEIAKLDGLLQMINMPNSPRSSASPTGQAAPSSTPSIVDRIPKIFRDAATESEPQEHLGVLARIPKVFLPEHKAVAKTTFAKRLFDKACSAEPPPAKRGGIKEMCNNVTEDKVDSDIRAYVEHRKTGQQMSTIRVRIDGAPG